MAMRLETGSTSNMGPAHAMMAHHEVDNNQAQKTAFLLKLKSTNVSESIIVFVKDKRLFLLLILIQFLSACAEKKPTINIAVASNFEPTLKKIIQQYPNKQFAINIISGSSGVLANQIINHAPYDLFISADTEKPQFVFEKLGLKTKPIVYATGLLSLWIPASSGNNCLQQLSTIKTFALPNPQTAPYGKAALEILTKNHITSEKIIQTSNASVSYIYTKDGLTMAGFVPYSLIKNEKEGCLQVFDKLGLDQSMVLLNDKAQPFYHFMQTLEINKIIKESGYL